MKKFLCGLVVVSSLAGCVPSQTNETTSVLKNTATQVSKIYINSAKTTVKMLVWQNLKILQIVNV